MDESKAETFSLAAVYITIFLLSLFGNISMIVCVTTDVKLHTPDFIFLGSVSTSDLLFTFLSVADVVKIITDDWVFGDVLCRMQGTLIEACVCTSILTLTCLSIERYRLICFPYKPKLTVNRCVKMVAGIWILSILICSPLFYAYSESTGNDRMLRRNWTSPCFVNSWSTESGFIYYSLQAIMIYVLPLFVLIYTHSKISVTLKQRGRFRNDAAYPNVAMSPDSRELPITQHAPSPLGELVVESRSAVSDKRYSSILLEKLIENRPALSNKQFSFNIQEKMVENVPVVIKKRDSPNLQEELVETSLELLNKQLSSSVRGEMVDISHAVLSKQDSLNLEEGIVETSPAKLDHQPLSNLTEELEETSQDELNQQHTPDPQEEILETIPEELNQKHLVNLQEELVETCPAELNKQDSPDSQEKLMESCIVLMNKQYSSNMQKPLVETSTAEIHQQDSSNLLKELLETSHADLNKQDSLNPQNKIMENCPSVINEQHSSNIQKELVDTVPPDVNQHHSSNLRDELVEIIPTELNKQDSQEKSTESCRFATNQQHSLNTHQGLAETSPAILNQQHVKPRKEVKRNSGNVVHKQVVKQVKEIGVYRRIVRMLQVLIVLFFTLWTPFFICRLLFHVKVIYIPELAWKTSLLVMFATTAVNFFVYISMSSRFRGSFSSCCKKKASLKNCVS